MTFFGISFVLLSIVLFGAGIPFVKLLLRYIDPWMMKRRTVTVDVGVMGSILLAFVLMF
jgi:hypothetical protein